MKKLYILALALVAVFAFTAVAASVVVASELLANGVTISPGEDLLAQLKGILLLEDTGAFGKPDVVCEGTFDLLIENGTLAFVNEVLDANGELLAATGIGLNGEQLAGDDIECKDEKGVCAAPVLVVAVNLPWNVNIVLLEGTIYEAEFPENAGYWLNCNTFLGLEEDFCDGKVFAKLTETVVGDVEGVFEGGAEGNCLIGGNGTGVLSGKALLEDLSAGVTFSLS